MHSGFPDPAPRTRHSSPRSASNRRDHGLAEPVEDKPLELRVLPGRFALLLLAGAILCTALSLTGNALKPTLLGKLLLYLFDLSSEGNVSTLYASFLLGICAFLLYTIYRSSQRSSDMYRFYWLGLAVIFAYLAVDEGARLHELLSSDVIRDYLLTREDAVSDVFVPTPWVLPAGVAVLVVGFLYLPFLFALPRRSAWLFVGAGAVYLSGAVLFEMLAWHYLFSMAGLEYAAHVSDTEYVLLTSIEELLEMGGAILFIYALLSHMAGQVRIATVRFAAELRTEPAGNSLGRGPRPVGDQPLPFPQQEIAARSRRSP